MTAGTGSSDDAGNSDIHSNEVKEFPGVAPLASLVENYDGITADRFRPSIMLRLEGLELPKIRYQGGVWNKNHTPQFFTQNSKNRKRISPTPLQKYETYAIIYCV